MRAMKVELPQGQGVVVGPVGEAAVVVVESGVGRHRAVGCHRGQSSPRGREREREGRGVKGPVGPVWEAAVHDDDGDAAVPHLQHGRAA